VENKSARKTPTYVIVVTVVFCVTAAGLAFLWFTDAGLFKSLRAGMYAREIANLNGDRGQATKNLIALGPDIALPHALKLLQSDEYTTRYYGFIILDSLDTSGAIEEIIQATITDDHGRNRATGITVLQHLCPDYKSEAKEHKEFKEKYLPLLVKLLDDPAPDVQANICNAMQNFSGTYNPDRDIKWWKDWWAKNKPGAAKAEPPPPTEQEE